MRALKLAKSVLPEKSLRIIPPRRFPIARDVLLRFRAELACSARQLLCSALRTARRRVRIFPRVTGNRSQDGR